MGRTACTEPQCLYKGALYLTVELYLYSRMGRTACTEPQCLYKRALYLLNYFLPSGDCTNFGIIHCVHTHSTSHASCAPCENI
jgi:hypothetical protein